MPDPILEELWRVRQQLIKQHGGLEGYFKYVQELERAHRKPRQHRKRKKSRKQLAKRAW